MACHVFNCRKCFVQHTFVWLFYCLARRLFAPSSCGQTLQLSLVLLWNWGKWGTTNQVTIGHIFWRQTLFHVSPWSHFSLSHFLVTESSLSQGPSLTVEPGETCTWADGNLSNPGLCLRKKLGMTIFPLLCKVSVYGYWAKCPSHVGRKRGHLGVKRWSHVTWQPVVTSHLNILWCAIIFIILILANKEHLPDM